MAQESKSTKDASDFEAVSAQLDALREDMAKLAETVSTVAARRGNRMASDIAEGLDEARLYAESKGKSAEAQIEDTVAQHPFMTIGLAAVAGFLVGALSRR